MTKILTSIILTTSMLLAACANTEYKRFEGKVNIYEGKGGTKTVVDSMDFWDNGEPPRKFSVLGIIDDQRADSRLTMSQLRNDVVIKAREAGGDAVIQITSQSQITGYSTSGSASVYGNSNTVYGSSTTSANRRNIAKFAVIKYVD